MSEQEKQDASRNLFIEEDVNAMSNAPTSPSRRAFFTSSAATVLGCGALSLSSENAQAVQPPIGPDTSLQRDEATRQLKIQAADRNASFSFAAQERNDDEVLYNDQRAVFGKTLKHKGDTFEVKSNSYQSLIDALASGDEASFTSIAISGNSDRKLANPQAAFSYDFMGIDSHSSRISPAPDFAGSIQAAEMGEVYWRAITRDVPFIDFPTSTLIQTACNDLNAFSSTVGPKIGGLVKPSTIFRGGTAGDRKGPYISQFLLKPVPYGPTTIEQRYATPVAGENFMTDTKEWLKIQKGKFPKKGLNFDPTPRYIYNQRALGEYVHTDVVTQAYLNAALIMLGLGPDALADSNPYKNSNTEGGFVTFGVANILDLITRAGTLSLKAAWYQKWLVHRRLRPEVMGMRVDQQRIGAMDYGINSDIINSNAVNLLVSLGADNNALLPLAFPEGSPTHPSYPAGHATIAGACSVILKAFFKMDMPFPDPVQANADGTALLPYTGPSLTLGGEIEKLAANITFGRDSAGVHYRSDGAQGAIAGEQMAARLLQDYSQTYSEQFDGFEVTRFSGNSFIIQDGTITSND